ncbi:MAG: SGNH hydrolase domain-containing protein [Cyanobacteriota bacterium]|jgi:hypothetical protein
MSYNLVEQPLRQARWSSSRLKVIVIGLGVSILSSLFILLIAGPLKGKLFTGRGGQELKASSFSSNRLSQEFSLVQRVKDMVKQCNVTPFLLGKNSYKSSRKIDRYFAEDCFNRVGLSVPLSQASKPRVIMVGDSFAEKLAPFAALAAKNAGFEFHLFYGYGCAYLLSSELIKDPSFPKCRYFNEQLLEATLLDSLEKGDVVILRLHYGNKSYVRYPSGHTQPSPDVYDAAILDLHRKIQAKKAHLLLVGGNPNLSTQDLAALRPDWFNAWNRTAKIDPRNSQETRFYHSLDDHLKERFGEGSLNLFLSLKSTLCPDLDFCTLVLNGKFLYEDDHHLSPYGHELFLPLLEKRLKSFS